MTSLRDQLQATLGDAYTLERELEGGGMARVFVAEEAALGRKVVVKVLPPDLSAEISVERFRREVRMAAGLQHPHVVPVLAAGGSADVLYYTMPFVEGESLHARLERERQLPVAEAVQLAREVAEALDYAHGRGIVHRDVKPENILLSGGHAMLTDFGIAKAAEQARGETLTATGLSLGTPQYMAPEQVTGETDVDGRADLYSLGCVLYEMLAGEPPFSGPTAQAVVAKHLSAPFPQVRHSRPDVAEEIDAVLRRATAKAPADRYPTAAAFAVELGASLAEPASARANTPWPERGLRTRGPMLRVIAAIVVVVALLVYAVMSRRRTTAAGGIKSIAVLPFENATRDSAQEYFSDGMTDEVASTLANGSNMRVAARTSSYAFKGRRVTPQEVGRELGVADIVQGSIRQLGDRLHVTAELVSTTDGLSLWSQTFDRKSQDIYAVQNEITTAIVQALRARLSGKHALASRTTENVQAYDSYLKGRYLWNQRSSGATVLRRAIGFFNQAIALDSGYAGAYAGLADAYSLLPAFGDGTPVASFPRARDAAQRALRLDSTLAEAHTSLGIVDVFYDWDWAAAAREFDRALALDSTEARTHLFHAWYYNGVGEYDAALSEVRFAQRLDPTSPVINARVGSELYYMHRFDDALAELRRALALDSSNVLARAEMARVLSKQGRHADALAAFPGVIDLEAGYLGGGELGYLYGRAGRRADALSTMRLLELRSHERYITPESFAMIEIGLDDSAAALDWLERGYREHSFFLNFLNDPMYDSLRASARFQRIVRGVGLRIPALRPARP